MSILVLRTLCAYFITMWSLCIIAILINLLLKSKNNILVVIFAPFLVFTNKGRKKLNKFLKGE